MTDEEKAENSNTDAQDPDEIFDYEKLLNRAWDSLPDSVKEHSRFNIPNVDALAEGNTTVVRNFADIASTLNREPNHLFSYLLKELGTAGVLEGRRVVWSLEFKEI